MLAIEFCAGGGGQALGIEQAGFECACALEIDHHACETLRLNRPNWNVVEADMKSFTAKSFKGIDLLAAGVPCPPFSTAGKQLGKDDERDLFPEALRLIEESNPKAFMLENVAGFASNKFAGYRNSLFKKLTRLGYTVDSQLLNASDFGVPQLRPRFLIVGLKQPYAEGFSWPTAAPCQATVGSTISDLLGANGWAGTQNTIERANKIAPTVVGGSKKHGGPDLGPTRAKRQWAELGIDGKGIANDAPSKDFPIDQMPKITNRMVARIQGFPDTWKFAGKKTATYRQIGNAFPPPVAKAVASCIRKALESETKKYPVRIGADGQLCVFEKSPNSKSA